MIKIKTKKEIEIMKEGGRILAKIMNELTTKVKPGITTKELDRACKALILSFEAKPSFEGYGNFPASVCTSVNEEIVHAVPSNRKLKEGDILSIDAGIYYKGYHADMALTVPAGEAGAEALRIIRTAKKALKRGIKKARAGNTFGDVGNTIQRYAESQGYDVIRDLCGHGIGKDLHEEPDIFNYGKRGKGEKIKEGMVFCIEPMISAGDWRIKGAQDGFGLKTRDDSLSAHFEHTIAITKTGPKILTKL